MKQKTTYISSLPKDGRLRKLSIFKPLSMLLLILLFGVNDILGQTYTQITTLGALVDGDYLVVGDAANDGMMINTASATPFINFSAVTNPGSSISSGFTSSNVFQITVVSGQITIYNSSVGYVSWGRTGNIGNTATFFNGTLANTEKWTPTVSGGLWTLSNVATPGRSLQWNSASPRFACYTSAQTRLKLYKSASSATITGAATATAFTTTYGAPSTAQTFSVSGSGLTSDITATAPTGFEVSNGGAYGATTTFTQSGGTASGTLSVRLKADAAVTGSYNSQNIVLSSTGATNVNVTTAASGNSVTAAALTISGISSTNKIYNASAIGSLTGTATYVGLQNSESFSVTGTPVATFAQSTIGTGIGVTVTGYTAPSTNYLVSQPSVSNADITEKPLTISGLTANNKVFDGNTTATLSGTASLVGVETADVSNVTLGGTYVADFVSSAVGTGIAVTVTGYTLSGSAAGNYSLTQPTGLTADITSSPSPVINSSLTATETYGVAITTYTITATNTPTSFNAVGLPAGLSVNTSTGEITGTPTTVGTYTVTISATNAGGTGNANFVYTINPKGLTVTGATADTKVYDGNTTATISGSTLVGIVGADVVTINTSGTFDTKNVGTGKVVTSTQTLVGADAAKYTVTIPTGLTADITPIALTISGAVAQNKVFDGNTTATITGTLSGVVSPDVVTLTLSGTFATSAVGTGIVVTSTSTIGGADVANYTLTQPTGLSANITAALVLYNFGTGSGTSAPTSGTPVLNLTFGNVTTGNSVNPSASTTNTTSASTGYTGVSGNYNYSIVTQRGAAFSTSTAAYYEVTITPASGYNVNLNSLSFGYRATASGATNIEIYTSADNFGSSISSYTVSNGGAWALSTPIITPVYSANPLVVRIFGYNPNGATLANNSAANFRIDDLSINADGTLIPPPTASVLSGSASFCAGSFTNLSVAVTGGASPYTVVVNDGGSNTYTVTSSTPVSIPVSAAGTYTVTSVTDANSNQLTGAGNTGSAVVTQNASSLPTSVGTYTQTQSQSDGTTLNYIDASCNLLARVQDVAGANVLGSTSTAATISATLPTDNTLQQFIPRYYTITPTSSGAATVTLYFTQGDFTSYNALKGGFYLPAPTTGNNADLNIGNLYLAQLVGGINGTLTEITPTLNWNSSTSVWECTANLSALGGQYYLFTKTSCPLVVTGLSSGSVTNNSAVLSWPAVVGVYNNTYKVRVKPVSGSTWNAQTITSTTFNSINLLPNTQYEFQVRAACSATEQGAYSASVYFTTLPNPCATVTGLTNGAITSITAGVSWSNSGASDYNVRIRVQGNGWAGHNTTSATNYNFSVLTPATTYEYQVRGVCSGVYANWSATQTFTTSATPCATVTGLTNGATTTTTAAVSWSATSATAYNVRIRVAGTSWAGHNTATGTSYTFANLTAGTNYEYQIRGICSGVYADWSTVQTISTSNASTCPTVTSLTNGTITSTTAGVSWTPSSATSYNVRVRVAGAAWGGHNTTTSTSYTFNYLTANNNYEYQVRGICSGVYAEWSAVGTFTTGAAMMPILFEEESLKAGFTVYPNPTRDQITIEFSTETLQATKVKVVDMTGRVVKTVEAVPQAGEHKYTLSLSELSAGMYTVQVYTDGKLTHVSKVQKQD